MVRLIVLYRNFPGARFDFDYYLKSHIKLAKELLADYGMLSFEVQRCLKPGNGDEPGYLCVSHVDFENMEGLSEGMKAHVKELKADYPNYTNINPEAQIFEVLARGS